MNITICGNDRRLSVCQNTLSSASFGGNLYLLPIPSVKPGEVPSFADIHPGQGDAVVGFGVPSEQSVRYSEQGVFLLDLEKEEEYQKKNAELTALGLLPDLFRLTKTALSELSVGIVGFGNIGQALLKILCFFGSRLSVYTRNPLSQKDLLPLGIDVYPSGDFTYHGEDVLINTAPAPLLSREAFPENLPIVLDLASGKCIDDSLPHEKLPALPLRVFEKSAAQLYTETVRRFLESLS